MSNSAHKEEFDRWSREVKKGAASLAILAVIERRSSYGYDIVKKLEEWNVSFLAFEQGTVYPLLRRLEKRKLLQSNWTMDEPDKPKKYYSITNEGRAALQLMTETWAKLSEEMTRIIGGTPHEK
jgi:PadR family transcriptional regulator PadR